MNTNSTAAAKPTGKMNVFAKPAMPVTASATVTFSDCASAPSAKAMPGSFGGFRGGVIG
jgi:hypothetical protein